MGYRYLSLLCIMLGSLLASPLMAASDIVNVYAGARAGTYQNISEDLKHLLAESSIKLDVHPTDGSIENIKQISASKTPAIGLVQEDVLGFMRRSENPDTKRFADRIRMIMPLYEEEVHILTHKSLKRFSDLQGKRVVVGEEGSGNMLTAVNLLAISDVRVGQTIRLTPAQGVLAVLEGKADAVIYVGGKPVKLFKNIESLETADGEKFSSLLENVHFIPVSSPQILAEYSTATITPEDYSFVEQTIPTIAVRAVMITGNYEGKDAKEHCATIKQAADKIRRSIPRLKKTGHPKWRDVNTSLPVSLWKRDACSWPKKGS